MSMPIKFLYDQVSDETKSESDQKTYPSYSRMNLATKASR